jgi:hypothetical protein
MLRRLLLIAVGLAVVAAVCLWLLTAPKPLPASALARRESG